MRIDAYQQIQQVYGAKQPQRLQKNNRTQAQDQLSISSKGQDIQTTKNALDNTPDVREEVVESLQSKIEAGTYKVGVDAFANHLFAKYNELHLGSF
ncbi:MAG: flagellar biosynthesis anti-sigma factor FlgM [Lachnospiraceae bacterium]|nr:flagellar biosynthesis anti-sigma factor FlgM [Lachnospiraceae bacterium]